MSNFLAWFLAAVPAILTMVMAIAALALVVAAWRHRSRGRRAVAHTVGEAAILISFGAIALLTLRGPLGDEPEAVNFVPFRDELLAMRGMIDPTYATTLLVANVVLFAPLGAALAGRFATSPAWVLVLAAMLVSLGIEAAQAVLNIGRQADVTDLLMNTLGAALGIVAWRTVIVPDQHIDRRIDRQ